MNEIVIQSTMVRLPAPKVEIRIRLGTMDDVTFIDALQSKTTKMVGWMPKQQIEGKIKLGHVLIAETHERVGYCIGNDQYFKRDDVGIIYALNVVPGAQRKLIGATLIQAMFERAAYGCRLFCCWCAQDIQANHFWESIGFVPIAFRAGSRGKGRVHIFWQKRIREGDTTTPYWFPSQTGGGAIREDRIVLPIPPGTHWSQAKPIILPEAPADPTALPAPAASRAKKARVTDKRREMPQNGMWFNVPKQSEAKQIIKPVREKKPKVKNDPRLVAAARELRDRWMEEQQSGRLVIEANGKYDVGRMIETSQSAQVLPELPAPVAA